jgi:hypothetical protein
VLEDILLAPGVRAYSFNQENRVRARSKSLSLFLFYANACSLVSQFVSLLREVHATVLAGVELVKAMRREMIDEQGHFVERFRANSALQDLILSLSVLIYVEVFYSDRRVLFVILRGDLGLKIFLTVLKKIFTLL